MGHNHSFGIYSKYLREVSGRVLYFNGISFEWGSALKSKSTIPFAQALIIHWYALSVGHEYGAEAQDDLMLVCLQAKFFKNFSTIAAMAFKRTHMVNVDLRYIFMGINTQGDNSNRSTGGFFKHKRIYFR